LHAASGSVLAGLKGRHQGEPRFLNEVFIHSKGGWKSWTEHLEGTLTVAAPSHTNMRAIVNRELAHLVYLPPTADARLQERIASTRMLPNKLTAMTGAASPNQIGGVHGEKDQHGHRREVVLAMAERYRSAGRVAKGRVLAELCAVTGWHRKHAVRTLRRHGTSTLALVETGERVSRKRRYGAEIKDALVALWEASDRICGKRLKVMIPSLQPALQRHGRLELGKGERALLLDVSAETIDRLLTDTKVAASSGRRRRVGFYSAIRREVPIRTFNDWKDPPPGFCEIDMVAHGGTSVAGSFIQTLTMVDVATGWTECLPLVTRESGLLVEALSRAQSLFPWLVVGADFDNDSAFMNDVVVPWCRTQKIEVTRSRAYKKNDQAFVEQKNGAVVRRLVGYGRFDGVETAQLIARLYAAARLHVNFFQPSFKLKDKRREGAK
jgi:hypothetical protein